MGCDELKSPILFFLVHRLRILKKQIWKSNNFADGMDHNRNDHDDWFWSFVWQHMKHCCDAQFAHNFVFILYYFFQISIGPSSLQSTSQKSVYFFAKDTLVLSIFLCDCWKMFICKLRKCTKHRYWSCSVSTLSLVRLLGGIFRVHQQNIYHSETISNVLFILEYILNNVFKIIIWKFEFFHICDKKWPRTHEKCVLYLISKYLQDMYTHFVWTLLDSSYPKTWV